MEFRIADTCTDSLARLTGEEQKAVKTTAFDLQISPANPGMSFHKLDKPGTHYGKCILDSERFRENPMTRSKADKAQQRDPCEAHTARLIEGPLPPAARLLMLGTGASLAAKSSTSRRAASPS